MIYCQKCLQQLPDGTMFCDICGTALLPGAALPPPDVPADKRADVRGKRNFTATPRLAEVDLTPATPPATQPRRQPEADRLGTTPPSERSGPVPRVQVRLTNGKSFTLTGKRVYLIGRRDPSNESVPDVDLADWNGAGAGVSRVHAAIHVEPDGVFVEDLESLNETIRNGYRLLPRQRYLLADGDELRLGSIMLLVVIS